MFAFRALSALSGGYLGTVMGSQPVMYSNRDASASTSALYLQDRVRKSSRRGAAPVKVKSPSVQVYDATKLLFINRDLAENYVIDSKHVPEMCRHNRQVAQQFGFTDIAQCWSLAELVATAAHELESDEDMFFNQIPFPKNILESM